MEAESRHAQQSIYISKKWIPLDFIGFTQYKKYMDKSVDEDSSEELPMLEVKLPEYLQSLGKMPEATKLIRDKRCKYLSKDLNINEAFYILSDLYLLTKNK